jgi:hypothetical protein
MEPSPLAYASSPCWLTSMPTPSVRGTTRSAMKSDSAFRITKVITAA